MTSLTVGVIHADDAYSKEVLLKILGISQKFWDKMLDTGLPYTQVGHARWVTGENVLNWFYRNQERKDDQGLGTN